MVVVLVVLALGGAAFALAGGSDDSATLSNGAAVVRSDLTTDDLTPALLSGTDVPARFTASVDPDDDSTDDGLPTDTSVACRLAMERLEQSDQGDRLIAEFEADDGASIGHELWVAAADDPSLAEVRAAIGSCPEMDYTEAEGSAHITMDVTPLDGIGDEAFAVDATIGVQGQGYDLTIDTYIAYFQRNGVYSTVLVSGPVGTGLTVGEPAPADVELAQELARLADTRIQESFPS